MITHTTNRLELLLDQSAEHTQPGGRHSLVTVAFRADSDPSGTGPSGKADLVLLTGDPMQVFPGLPHIGGPSHETWTTSRLSSVQSFDQGALAHDGDLLFGCATSGSEAHGDTLDQISRILYDRLLTMTSSLGYDHLFRVWAYVPAINTIEDGLERYQRFCRGRAVAFEQHFGPGFSQNLCASSAVGRDRGPLAVHVLAGREPGQHLENPRQVAAWQYPVQYGPRSPSFARATIVPERTSGSLMLISGTASIVGHETWHIGNVEAQTRETLKNLEALLGIGRTPYQIVTLRVYLRHAADFATVAPIVNEWLGDDARIVWLRADICRPDLLVEIEGIAAPAV